MSIYHKNIVSTENHGIHSWEVANATIRQNMALVASDIGKVALQLDDKSLWTVANNSPSEWRRIDQGPGFTVANPLNFYVGSTLVGLISMTAGKEIVVGDATSLGNGPNTVTIGTSTTILTILPGAGIATSWTAGISIGSGNRVPGGSIHIGWDGMLSPQNTGLDNIAIGRSCLNSVEDGEVNIAMGDSALGNNKNGSFNVAMGYALANNTSGLDNIAIGDSTLNMNLIGNENVAIGYGALANTDTDRNVAIGVGSLGFVVTGERNVGIGVNAGSMIANSGNNIDSTRSVFVGYQTMALANGGTNENVFGYEAIGNGSNTVTLGNDSITDTYLKGIAHIGGDITASGKITIDTPTAYIVQGGISSSISLYQLNEADGSAGLDVYSVAGGGRFFSRTSSFLDGSLSTEVQGVAASGNKGFYLRAASGMGASDGVSISLYDELGGIKIHSSALYESSIPNSGSAVAHTLNSPSYVTAGAKLLSIQNNGVEKFRVDKDGDLGIISASVVATGSTTPRTLSDRFSVSYINALDFGCVGDGITGNDAALNTLAEYLILHPGSEVVFPPGEYLYEDNLWASGVDAHFRGYGAKLRCTRSWAYGDYPPGALRAGADQWTWPTPPVGNEIATVAAFSDTVTFLTPAYAANFSVGDRALAYGYCHYPGGWPPSFRHKEWGIVKSVNVGAGTVTLCRKLRQGYRQDWREYGLGIGYARLLNLSTLPSPIRTAFTGRNRPPHEQSWEGFDFPINPNEQHYAYMSQGPWGLVTVGGASGRIRLTNCRMGMFVAGDTPLLEVDGCEMEFCELDKTAGNAIFRNCSIGVFGGGTSWDSVKFYGCHIGMTSTGSTGAINAQVLTEILVENCDLYNPASTSTMTVLRALQVSMKNCRVHSSVPIAALTNSLGSTDATVAPGSTPTRTVLRFTSDLLNHVPMKEIFPGVAAIIPARGWVATVKDVYFDSVAGQCVVEFLDPGWNDVPTTGDVVRFPAVQRSVFSENIDVRNGNQSIHFNEIGFASNVEGVQRSQSGDTTIRTAVPFFYDGINHGITAPRNAGGLVILKSYRIVITQAGAAGTISVYPTGGVYWGHAFRTDVAGVRVITPDAVHGLAANDGAFPIPDHQNGVSQLNFFMGGGITTPYPSGYIEVEWLLSPL
jgi:hypothetical protein